MMGESQVCLIVEKKKILSYGSTAREKNPELELFWRSIYSSDM